MRAHWLSQLAELIGVRVSREDEAVENERRGCTLKEHNERLLKRERDGLRRAEAMREKL